MFKYMQMQCDRCKRFYPYSTHYQDRYTVTLVRWNSTNKTLDICPECTQKLTEFMKGEE